MKSTRKLSLANALVHQPGMQAAIALEPEAYLPTILRFTDGIVPFGPIHTGEGTYYNATGAGNCLFLPSPDNLMVAAMNHTDYDTAALCGAFISVQGPDGTVVVRIVDRCPECPEGDVDLSQEAFVLTRRTSAWKGAHKLATSQPSFGWSDRLSFQGRQQSMVDGRANSKSS